MSKGLPVPQATANRWNAPKQATAVDAAFGPPNLGEFLPPMTEIPAEFQRGSTVWNRLVSEWFFSGLDADRLVAKEGVDRRTALAHLKTVLVSFEPRHEHKEAGAAYLMSLWFEVPKN